jgi:hypothetical protein
MTLAHRSRKRSVCVVVARGDIARCWIACLLLATHATFLGTTCMNAGIFDLLMLKSNTRHVVKHCRDEKSRIDAFDGNENMNF